MRYNGRLCWLWCCVGMILAGCGQVISNSTDSRTMVPLLGLTLPTITPSPILRLLRTPALRTTSIFTRTVAPTPLPVTLESPTCYETPVGSLWCLGIVHNTLTTPVGQIVVHVYLVRADGTALLDQQVTAARKMLASGESSPYGVLFNEMPADAAGPIALLVSTSSDANVKSIAVHNVQSAMADGQFHVTGTLVNSVGKTLNNVSIVVTLFDAKGAVTGFKQFNLSTGNRVVPDATLPFALDVIPQGSGTTRAEVSAEGQVQ